MEVVHTCPDVRYWSEALCCSMQTHMSDLEVKAAELEIIYVQCFGISVSRQSGIQARYHVL